MRVQAFVFDWPGKKQHALANAAVIAPFCPVEIIDNPNFYFTEQWEFARSKFNGDILLTIMADVWPPEQFESMFKQMVAALSNDKYGIYAPAVEFTGHKLWKHKASQVTANLYDTPVPEMLCWSMRKNVLDTIPHVDPKVNKFGWGIDYLAVAKCWRTGRRALTDFNFTALHEKGTGYGCEAATAQYEAWLKTLPQIDRDGILEVVREQDRLCVNTTKKVLGGATAARARFHQGLRSDKDRVTFDMAVPTDYDGWLKATYDVQDLHVLNPVFTEDALRACQANGVNNVTFLIPQNPEEWLHTYQARCDPTAKQEYVTCWHWRHPKWELNLTDVFGVPCAWLLPAKMKYWDAPPPAPVAPVVTLAEENKDAAVGDKALADCQNKFSNIEFLGSPPYIPEPEGGM